MFHEMSLSGPAQSFSKFLACGDAAVMGVNDLRQVVDAERFYFFRERDGDGQGGIYLSAGVRDKKFACL